MRTNMGIVDRSIRMLAGVIILFFVSRTPWAWIGVVPLVTGMTGFCPLYSAFGWSTNRPSART